MYLFPGTSPRHQEPFGSLTLPTPQRVTQVQGESNRKCARFRDVTSTSLNALQTELLPKHVHQQQGVSMATTDDSLTTPMTQLKLDNGPTSGDSCDGNILQNDAISVRTPVKQKASNEQEANPSGTALPSLASVEAETTPGSQAELSYHSPMVHDLYQRQWYPTMIGRELI